MKPTINRRIFSRQIFWYAIQIKSLLWQGRLAGFTRVMQVDGTETPEVHHSGKPNLLI
jgi:hypothetical protein